LQKLVVVLHDIDVQSAFTLQLPPVPPGAQTLAVQMLVTQSALATHAEGTEPLAHRFAMQLALMQSVLVAQALL
jgi:hypothetical protein